MNKLVVSTLYTRKNTDYEYGKSVYLWASHYGYLLEGSLNYKICYYNFVTFFIITVLLH